MNIVGLTPIDSALSAIGLNIAHQILDFIFTNSNLGMLLFAVGFIFSLVRFVRTRKYRFLIIFFSLFMIIQFLLLPKADEGNIQSAQEIYGVATDTTAKNLKNSLVSDHQRPVLLSFINQSIDAAIFALINTIDKIFPEWGRFSTTPFGIQNDFMGIFLSIDGGINDASLKQRLNRFLSDHYFSALSLYKRSIHGKDNVRPWPGYSLIVENYSKNATTVWNALSRDLKNYLNNTPQLNHAVQDRLEQISQQSNERVQEALVRLIIEREMFKHLEAKKVPLEILASFWVIKFLPYIYGFANLACLALFPVMIIAIYLSLRINLGIIYLRLLLWVKSWVITSAFSSFASLVMARVQIQGINGLSLTLDYPVFCVVAVLLLILAPIFTFLLFNKMGG